MASDEAEESSTRESLHRVTGTLRPYRSGSYLNFEEEAADPASFYGAETYRRLQAVKADVDPDELFRANHPIPPAPPS
jgi:FAD/FMN-containing dehydrogenase